METRAQSDQGHYYVIRFPIHQKRQQPVPSVIQPTVPTEWVLGSILWERQIPKEEDYWREYFQKEELNLIVRDSYPKLTFYPSIQRYPRNLNNGIRNNDDANTLNNLICNDNKPFLESIPNDTSLSDNDLFKYSTRYAHEALKRLAQKMHFGIRKLNERRTKVFPLETMEDSKEIVDKSEEKFSKITRTSLQSLSDYEVDEKVHSSPRISSSRNFLNKLPIMSYFPRRKNQDRCLSCLYKSLEEIGASLSKSEHEKRRKKRILEGKLSMDCESDDDRVNFVELKDQKNENEFMTYEKEIKFDVTQEKKNIVEEDKLSLQGIQGTANEMKEIEGSLQVELKSMTNVDKKIELEKFVTTTSLDKSKDPASNSDEDESSITYVDNSSTKLKYKPACHAPTILRHPLEPLRALKLKKSTSMQTRMAINESTESTIDDLADENLKIASTKIGQEETLQNSKNNLIEIDSKPVKKLTKIKSVCENLIPDGNEDVSIVNDTKNKNLLRRSSSCTNFEEILKDFTKGTEFASPVLHSLNEEEQEKPQRQRSSLFTKNEIEEKLKDLEIRNVSPTSALSTMCDMFLNRILELNDNRDKSRDKIAKSLVKLLIESRRYTNPDKFPSDLIFSSKQRPLLNGQRLRRILPLDSYNLIAPLLGMPEHYPRLPFALPKLLKFRTTKQRSDRSDSTREISEDLIVHPPSVKDSMILDDETKRTRSNPYELFMKKERRKAIVWRPLTEYDLRGYDPEATIRMRADKITTDICEEFCEWLRSLGGLEKGINETVLKDMFEISFSADVCKSTQINVKEMATVPTDVALARLCQEASVLATTRKQLERDAKAESKPKRVLAFGTSMPTELLFVPPENQVREKWLECKSVPLELETMDVVWDGIIHLNSVQAFIKWLHLHPEVSPPEIFKRSKITEKKKTTKNHPKEKINA
ncbi:uncharacterized protein LOC122515317 [Polistes fuscatus]|uniref:uncharacterized protein LOC122515317 n=1 Tax=Polistes fuscatus TaxID=30207 RepID=UPI001CAA0B74|nr:uncharacterized protein LOC122515317 [Polistes fuscatus]